MTATKAPLFKSFEEYLEADPSDLPEGHCEYWDGELLPVMTESFGNLEIADDLADLLVRAGVPRRLLKAGRVEVEVSGRPRSRFPDLVVLDESHGGLLKKRATITRKMPPPRLVVEVVSPGDEKSENYQRDYQDKPQQYAAISVPEYWIIDPDRDWVKVGILTNGGYDYRTFQGDEAIVSPTFPGFNLTASQVLRTEH